MDRGNYRGGGGRGGYNPRGGYGGNYQQPYQQPMGQQAPSNPQYGNMGGGNFNSSYPPQQMLPHNMQHQQQQPYNAGYPQGGYAQRPPPQQYQQQQPPYNQQPYGFNPAYQRQGPPMGYAPRGMRGAQQSYHGRGGGFYRGNRGHYDSRGRGNFSRGGGRGGHGGRGGREFFSLVHLSSFAQLEDVGRRGSLDVLGSSVIETLTRRARGNPMRILLVVEKKYIAACMSVPRGREDVFLSPETTKTFMNVENVLSDDGDLLIKIDNAMNVARHLFVQFNRYLTSLAAHDRPPTDAGNVDIFTVPPHECLKLIEENKTIYQQVEKCLLEDTEQSTNLFKSLTFAPPVDSEENEGDNDGDDDNAKPGTDGQGRKFTPRRRCLLSSAQGSRLFLKCMQNGTKRKLYFSTLQGLIGTPADGMFFVKNLFNGVLVSEFVLNCFGCSLKGATVTKSEEESKIICDGFARYGIFILRTNGGSSLLSALLQELRPGYKSKPIGRINTNFSSGNAAAGEESKATGGKRPRDEEVTKESTADDKVPPKVAPCPKSLEEYEAPQPPKDWSIFFAVARAFMGGEIVPVEGSTEEESEEARRTRRLASLTEHIVACRAVQIMIPHFADTVLETEKQKSTPSDAAIKEYQENSNNFLMSLAQRFLPLVSDRHGNYVAQTLIAELAPRAIPGTHIESVLRAMNDVLVDNVIQLSSQRCSSNCVERALECTMSNPAEGNRLLFRIAEKFLAKGSETMQIAINEFGNYVIRHVVESLSSLVQGRLPTSNESEAVEAKNLEKQFFDLINKNVGMMQGISYGTGILTWLNMNKDRIQSA